MLAHLVVVLQLYSCFLAASGIPVDSVKLSCYRKVLREIFCSVHLFYLNFRASLIFSHDFNSIVQFELSGHSTNAGRESNYFALSAGISGGSCITL